jgi:carbonic anhydrase
MNRRTARVMTGWLSLSEDEKQEFQGAVDEFNRGGDMRKQLVRESVRDSVQKIDLGPVKGACPCCGR